MKNKFLFFFLIFAGSFLLFQIQPIMGKYLLPWFGGVPAVWTACLLFFQLFLLGGYLYAHLLQRLRFQKQLLVHVALLLCTVTVGTVLFFKWGNPILPEHSMNPSGSVGPTWRIIYLLSISIGLAYFLLSTSTSLLQAWFHRVSPAQSPYFLYALSNTAALLALLSYPFVIEPLLTTNMQALLWSGGFLVYAAVCTVCAVKIRQTPKPDETIIEEETDEPSADQRPNIAAYLLWTALAACGVLTLMSVTNQMTRDLPPIPFLWVLALALYLLSYVLGFTERLRKLPGLCLSLLLLAIGAAWVLIQYPNDKVIPMIAAYGFILFATCLFCHNALFRTKPHPRYLTGFYLCLSLGGVLAGLFVAIIAPKIFNFYWEYQLALVMATLLALILIYKNPNSRLYALRHAGWIPVILLAASSFRLPENQTWETIYRNRDFFGLLRIDRHRKINPPSYILYNGYTKHGAQYRHPQLVGRTTTYYTENSGVGQAILKHPKREARQPMHIGIVGLGVGTLAAYGTPGDIFDIYEINPTVVDLACSTPYFTYLADSAADAVNISVGDGRIQLEKEWEQSGSKQFDLLILDAFSGDSVPAHLLTEEAFELYLNHLAPEGLLLIHISNRYLDLVPLMQAQKEKCGIASAFVHHNSGQKDRFAIGSSWTIFAKDQSTLNAIKWENIELHPQVKTIRPWTDNFSNLLSLF